MKENKTYANSESFFLDFIEFIKKEVPNYKELVLKGKSEEVIYRLKPIGDKEFLEVEKKIRKLTKIPKNIDLRVDNNATTYYCSFDTRERVFFIACPKTVVWHVRYKNLIKSAMKHEMGHIINGDLTRERKNGHNQCSNICSDIRINHYIDETDLKDLFDAVFYYRLGKDEDLVKELSKTRLKEIGLESPNLDEKMYSFDLIHTFYHNTKGEEEEEKRKDDDGGFGSESEDSESDENSENSDSKNEKGKGQDEPINEVQDPKNVYTQKDIEHYKEILQKKINEIKSKKY